MNWQEIAQSKKLQVNSNIPNEWRIDTVSVGAHPNANDYVETRLTKREIEITNTTILELLQKYQSGEYTVLEVIKAFCHRVSLLHQLCNCLSEIFFTSAYERAAELDQYFATKGVLKGKLHGIPISLKDQFNLPGVDSCLGFTANVGKPHNEMSQLAKSLYDEGGLFYIKTAVPTSLMSGDCFSNLHGYTLNAINRNLSSGGSSGGEATVVAGKGSLIGFGTDVGGSIRNPSSFQGLYGLKPSADRLSYEGVTNVLSDHPILKSSIGPICRNIEDLQYVMKVAIDNEPWVHDPKVPPIAWQSITLKPKLKIGVLSGRPGIFPHPAIERGIKEFIDKVGQTHYVINIDHQFPVDYFELSAIGGKLFGISGYDDIKAKLAETQEIVGFLEYMKLYSISPLTDEWELQNLKTKYQLKFYKFFEEFDCIVTPTFMETSYEPGSYNFQSLNSAFVNILDFTAMTLPLTTVNDWDVWPPGYTPVSEVDHDIYHRFDINKLLGAPVSVQIIGKRYDEERVMALGKLFNQLMNS